MKRWIAAGILILALTGCSRYEPAKEMTRAQEESVQSEASGAQNGQETQEAEAADSQVITISTYPPRNPVKVKGIYVSAYVAGTGDMMDKIIEEIDRTELNAVVIDVKDDQGRITYAMDSPTVNEIGACQVFIQDMPALMAKLKEHGIYTIARVVAFRDPYLAEQKPERSLHVADGKIYRDNKGLAWVNPYKKEVWDYLIEVGKKAGEAGFDEIQFDYIRFAVDKTMNDVVFDDADTQGRNKTQAITEFIGYAHDELAKEGLFVSADVFGTIMRSEEDAGNYCQIFDSNYMTQAEKWPGKLFDPDALKAYMPEESGEKKGVYEDQVATFKADTLDELAKKLGITDAAAFKKSVERYNALAAEGKDEDFGKDGKWLTTIDTPPFYGIHRKVRVSAIVSGVHVGEHMEVLKADSTEPIKGLYAIGNTAGDFYCGIDYTMWMPGLSLGRAHTQGYVMGKYVANL